MEFYALVNLATFFTIFFGFSSFLKIKMVGLIIGFLLWIALFTLQGFGLYAMAKGQNMKKRWMAFCPFVNVWYIGKLTGKCKMFSREVRHAGLYAMIGQILTSIFSALLIASQLYLYVVEGVPNIIEVNGIEKESWGLLTGFSHTVFRFYEIAPTFFSIVQLVYEIFMFILLMGLYKKYSIRNYMPLSFLCLFIPSARFIVIFVLRKKTPIDYDAYMRARREAFMRQQQQYQNAYGNPYGNPYGSPYGNPYGNPYAQGQNQTGAQTGDPFEEFTKNEDPFEEFSDNNGQTQDPNPADDTATGNTQADDDIFQ